MNMMTISKSIGDVLY